MQEDSQLKILFIGGTGRLSKDVAEKALNDGNEVYLLTRGTNERKKFVLDGYHMIYGNIRNAVECKKILEPYDFDVIIDFLTYNKEQLIDTLDVLAGKFEQYIFISSATVYKKSSEDELIAEDKTEIGNNLWKYAYDKYLCEEYLKEYFDKKPKSYYTVIRPYVTYGNTRVPYPIVPNNTHMEWTLIDRIKLGRPIPVFDGGNTVTTLTHTKDFAKGVVGLFGNEKAYNEAFHITSDKTTTWGQVLDAIEKKLSTKVIRAEFTQEEIYSALPEYKGILVGDKGTTMRFDNSKIHNAVPEYKCDISLEDGVADMIDFYNENPNMKIIDYAWNGRVDKLCTRHRKNGMKKYKFPDFAARKAYLCNRYSICRLAMAALRKILK